MVIFHSYVKLPEGRIYVIWIVIQFYMNDSGTVGISWISIWIPMEYEYIHIYICFCLNDFECVSIWSSDKHKPNKKFINSLQHLATSRPIKDQKIGYQFHGLEPWDQCKCPLAFPIIPTLSKSIGHPNSTRVQNQLLNLDTMETMDSSTPHPSLEHGFTGWLCKNRLLRIKRVRGSADCIDMHKYDHDWCPRPFLRV